MKRIRLKAILLACTLSLAPAYTHTALADTTSSNAVVMENCGAYLFEWRPVGYENGKYFAILVGGDTINESDVILNRGYDYPYTCLLYTSVGGRFPVNTTRRLLE